MSILGKYVGDFEGVKVFESQRMGIGCQSAAIALPGYGMVVGKGVLSEQVDIDTVRHEFGHFLQYRKTGLLKFYFLIGLPSLLSACTNGFKKGHQNFWTEEWCNYLSKAYFKDHSWNICRFPAKDISASSKFWLTNFKI